MLFSLASILRPAPADDGIAIKYPGDQGIESHPSVVFVETFDERSITAITKRWPSIQNAEILSLSSDTPTASSDDRSLLITHVGGQGTGGHLYRPLEPGYEKLHIRFYVKFDPDCAPIHHFFHVGGYNPSTEWPQGGAGNRPRGNERFSTGVEPHGDHWTWDYYSYWSEMRGSPPRGQTWGNTFIRDPSLAVQRGKWICLELMMQMNDIGECNGQMAFWIDGKQASKLGEGFPKGKWIFDKFLPGQGGPGNRWNDEKKRAEPLTFPTGGTPFEGFRWRTDPKLNLNFLWVLLYITKAPKDHISRIWFDNIIVAEEYIGPIAAEN
ncbi:MAG: hypothetical protein P8L85_22275 [Rubripirellula sp.]|nr:hypothetical protein [Rubripirellula sp.]